MSVLRLDKDEEVLGVNYVTNA